MWAPTDEQRGMAIGAMLQLAQDESAAAEDRLEAARLVIYDSGVDAEDVAAALSAHTERIVDTLLKRLEERGLIEVAR